MTTNNSSTRPIVFGCVGSWSATRLTPIHTRAISMARADGRLVIFRYHLDEKK